MIDSHFFLVWPHRKKNLFIPQTMEHKASRAKRAIREWESRTGRRNLNARRAFNEALRAGARRRPGRINIEGFRGRNVEENFQTFLRTNASAVKDRFPYLVNKDGTSLELSHRTRMGATRKAVCTPSRTALALS